MGFFKQKELLENKTPNPNHERGDQKVVMVLVDALREDFIEWPKDHGLDLLIDPNEELAYKGTKFQVFKNLIDKYPESTVLRPAKSAMPTITVVRVKNFITGGISSLFETTSEFVQSEVYEDTIFH